MEDAREADKWDVSIDSNIRVPEAVLQDSGRMVRELKKIGDVIGKLLLSTEEIAELCRSYINRKLQRSYLPRHTFQITNVANDQE